MRRIFKPGDISVMMGFLSTYQRAGDHKSWDTFREKIPVLLLKAFGDVLIECRRNGFVSPRVEGGEFLKGGDFVGGKIIFQQLISTNERTGDMCTMCERDCRRREQIENGELKIIRDHNKNNPRWKEPAPCWS
jgi:hypothetical protein